MYQDNISNISDRTNQVDKKRSRFALLYATCIQIGKVELGTFPKKKMVSFRSQLNRFRVNARSLPNFNDQWDLVSNRADKLPSGDYRFYMEYDKGFWDSIDEQLGLLQEGLQEPISPPLGGDYPLDEVLFEADYPEADYPEAPTCEDVVSALYGKNNDQG